MKVQVAEKFRIRTQQGKIELKPGQVIALTEEKAKGLLMTGRVVPVMPEDPTKRFREQFERTDSDLVAAYKPGTMEMIREDVPDLWAEIQEAEDGINILWLQAREGIVTVGNFNEAVDLWKTLHLRAIRFFSLTEGYTREQ